MTDEITGAELLADVYEFTGKFIAYPSDEAHVAHVLWIVHTHLMEAWESTPRLAFLSPEPASGKTRALEISELLVPNPVEAINVTPAYLFRKVGADNAKPTILYDEIDTVFGPKAKENEEIRGLLNAGHRRGAVAGRCVVHGKQVMTEEISAYCAVALAGLGWLPDTILSRSVIIRMRRRGPGEKVMAYRRRVHAPFGQTLRECLVAWSAGEVEAMADARPEMPPGIEDRDADVWEPLLAIADAVGGDWPVRARGAAVALVGAARDAEPSLGIKLLADLKTLFDASTLDAMPTEVILSRLTELPESPWGDLGGKPINDRKLGRRLREYGVKSWLSGSATKRPEVTSGRTCKMPGCGTSPLMTPQRRNKRNKYNRRRELAGFRRKMLQKPRKTSATDPQRAQQMLRIASATALLSATEIFQRNQALLWMLRMLRLCGGMGEKLLAMISTSPPSSTAAASKIPIGCARSAPAATAIPWTTWCD